MSLVGFRAANHPQQVNGRGADDETDDRTTPADLFAELHRQYRFTLDVAAAPHNAQCPVYFTRRDDGLAQRWSGSVWCNPPYSDLTSWLAKAWAEWAQPDGPERIVLLLPGNRCEQPWWQTWVEPYRDRPGSPLSVRFLPGRLRFIKPGATVVKPNERPPFGCVLVVFGD